MSEHRVKLSWSRNGRDFTYKTYSRDHLWKFENNVEVRASAAPKFLGNPECIDPEAAFVASLSSCHMLTFLALCTRQGIVVERYLDDAVGYLEKNASGKLAVTRVELRPHIEFGTPNAPDAATLATLHERSHHECFIANSVLTQISVRSAQPGAQPSE